MVNIKRPMGIISIIFMLIVLFVLEIRGGVDEGASCICSTGEGEERIYLDGKEVKVRGEIDEKIYKNNKHSIHIKNALILKDGISSTEKTSIIIYLAEQDEEDFCIGQTITAEGVFSDFDLPENDGQFNMRRYYRIRGFSGSVLKGKITGSSVKYNRYREFLHDCRQVVKNTYFENMSEPEAGTLTAIVTGDKSGLDEDIKELYQIAGMAHVLSLSGLHIASIGLGLFSLLIKAGLGTKLSSLISSVIMISYSIMTGMSTSTVRALIMFMLGLIARNLYRSYDLLSAVYLSALLILFNNPYYIYDSGFMLSVSAVAGIGIIYPVLDNITSIETQTKNFMLTNDRGRKVVPKGKAGRKNKVRLEKIGYCIRGFYDSKRVNRVRQGICISVSVTVSTLPIVMNSFYLVPGMGIILNIIVVPLMGILLGIGVLGGLLCGTTEVILRALAEGGVGKSSGFLFCKIILYPAQIILRLYTKLAEGTGGMRESTWVMGKAEKWQIIVYIILVIAICQSYSLFLNAERPGRETRKKEALGEEMHSWIKKLITIALICISVAIISYRKRPDFSINVLSVGQGACNVIYGKNVPVIMIDGGSTDVKEVYKYRIEPFLLSKGIGWIDYLFVTHADDDHISGVIEMLADSMTRISVRNIFIGDEEKLCKLIDVSVAVDEENTKLCKLGRDEDEIILCQPEWMHTSEYGLLGYIEKQGNNNQIKVYEFGRGDSIKKENIVIECISPERGVVETDENDASLVLKVSYLPTEFSALFTGDISSDVERKIINMPVDGSSRDIENVDFLTVAHHGSKYSSCAEFLSYVNPLVSTISSGAGNSYGHPHKETLERLDKYAGNTRVFRTDTCGQITVNIEGSKIIVRKFYNIEGDVPPPL